MPGGGLPAGAELHGPLSGHDVRAQNASADTGRRLSAARLEVARAQLPGTARRAARLLHGQQHHANGSDCEWFYLVCLYACGFLSAWPVVNDPARHLCY